VPMMEIAAKEAASADIFLVVGTSLAVYPAAGLIDYIGNDIPKFIIDPNMPPVYPRPNIHLFEENGTSGVKKVSEILRRDYL